MQSDFLGGAKKTCLLDARLELFRVASPRGLSACGETEIGIVRTQNTNLNKEHTHETKERDYSDDECSNTLTLRRSRI